MRPGAIHGFRTIPPFRAIGIVDFCCYLEESGRKVGNDDDFMPFDHPSDLEHEKKCNLNQGKKGAFAGGTNRI